MATKVGVECLRCGHAGTISEAELQSRGFKPDAPLATISKRLICGECGSRAIKAWRFEEKAA